MAEHTNTEWIYDLRAKSLVKCECHKSFPCTLPRYPNKVPSDLTQFSSEILSNIKPSGALQCPCIHSWGKHNFSSFPHCIQSDSVSQKRNWKNRGPFEEQVWRLSLGNQGSSVESQLATNFEDGESRTRNAGVWIVCRTAREKKYAKLTQLKREPKGKGICDMGSDRAESTKWKLSAHGKSKLQQFQIKSPSPRPPCSVPSPLIQCSWSPFLQSQMLPQQSSLLSFFRMTLNGFCKNPVGIHSCGSNLWRRQDEKAQTSSHSQ